MWNWKVFDGVEYLINHLKYAKPKLLNKQLNKLSHLLRIWHWTLNTHNSHLFFMAQFRMGCASFHLIDLFLVSSYSLHLNIFIVFLFMTSTHLPFPILFYYRLRRIWCNSWKTICKWDPEFHLKSVNNLNSIPSTHWISSAFVW